MGGRADWIDKAWELGLGKAAVTGVTGIVGLGGIEWTVQCWEQTHVRRAELFGG
ncbi:hypothetical protein NOR_01812 [Metarhizium rileyi]|uniref:Uncharacterized protein n=1 Tax=Metarhizium rileyi (strain RCEF 4871) TaxID=1649241 RepID=A0A167I1D1_METRR|nr:hypothetical protein NOR_01812 [Metarhizium rileyi RCEF 4871]